MRKNNFDILRLLCAISVILLHSYALLGLNDNELLLKLTDNIIWSDLGLCGFFTISGYLIYKSLTTSWSKKIKTTILIVSTLLSVGFIVFQITSLAMLCLSILFILFGEMCCEKIYNFIHKIGDLLYGTYIYAFPISQILILLFNLKISPTILTMLTLLFVLPIAYLSWRFVEKPALALKKYL